MIDAHAHLHEMEDADAAIRRAVQAGVEHIIAVGMELGSNRKNLELSRRFPEIIHPAIGYHPWSITAAEMEENLLFIENHLAACIALGEVGLDYRVKINKRLQREAFARLLRLAAALDRPVIVHTRFSHQRAYDMLREAGVKRAVFHWYSGPLEVLELILAGGYLGSATPALTYSPPHQEAMKYAPLARILLETDAPTEYQGKTSEPADLLTTARELSRLQGLELAQVMEVTTASARRFFGI